MVTVKSQILVWWQQAGSVFASVTGLYRYTLDSFRRMFGVFRGRAPSTVTDGEEESVEMTREEEEQYARIATSLGRLFPFVQPSPEFRAQLKEALLAEHRQRLAYRVAAPAPQEGGISWRWSLAATVPLLIGVLATILWRRSHRSDEQLISPIGGR